MIKVIRSISLVFMLSLIYLSSCCSTKNVEENQETQTTQVEDSIPVVDSLSFQKGLKHAVEEKLLKVHKVKLK